MGCLLRSADGDSSIDMFDEVRLFDDVDNLCTRGGLIDGLFANVKASTAMLLRWIRIVPIARDNWRRRQ